MDNNVYIYSFEASDIVGNRIESKTKRRLDILEDSLDRRKLFELEKLKSKDRYEDKMLYPHLINVAFDLKLDNGNGESKNTKQLRKELYENGFVFNGIVYVRYKRSAGSGRNGRCLFINKNLFLRMNKWTKCGLDTNKASIKNNLVSFEAYKALSLSGIECAFELPFESILLLKDEKSKIFGKDETVALVSGNSKNGVKVEIRNLEKKDNIENTIWDGEGLLDESVFNSIADTKGRRPYKNKGMLLLRNRFFKSCVFNTRLQKFFKDNNITDISQLNKECKTLAKNISDIKLVITESSLKYLKFGDFEQWVKNCDPIFGVVKTDKKSNYFNGTYITSNYQFLNTVGLAQYQIKELAKPTTNLIQEMRNDSIALKLYCQNNHRKEEVENEEEEELNEGNARYEVVRKLLEINYDMEKTRYYVTFSRSLTDSLHQKAANGEIFIPGYFATLFGNGYELLLHTIGKYEETFKNKGKVFTKGLPFGSKIVGVRSPNICCGNLYLANNEYNEIYDRDNENRYFNLTNEIVCVNAIGENLQHRLNGADYDSDTMLVTNEKSIVDAVEKQYNVFATPVNNIKGINKKGRELWEIDHETSNNYIGEIVNKSQIINSMVWDKYFNKNEDWKNDYENVCKLAVMSGMEIDSAKRSFDIEPKKVLDSIIKEKYGNIQYPLFFEGIHKLKDKKVIRRNTTKYKELKENRLKKGYTKYNCPMDNLYKHITQDKPLNTHNISRVPLTDFLLDVEKPDRNSYNRCNRYLKIMNELDEAETEIYKKKYSDFSRTLSEIKLLYESKEKDIKNQIKDIAAVKLIIERLENEAFKNKEDREYIYATRYLYKCLFFILKNDEEMLDRLFKHSGYDLSYVEIKQDRKNSGLETKEFLGKKYEKRHSNFQNKYIK